MINTVNSLDRVKLVLAGKNIDREILIDGIVKHSKFTYLGFISHKEVITNSMQADILFVFYDPNVANYRYSTPNKLFEAMMCGKPLIINEGIAGAKIVEEEKCGIVVKYGNINDITNALLILQDSTLRKELGSNGRKAYETKYSWKIMEERLINAYNSLDIYYNVCNT